MTAQEATLAVEGGDKGIPPGSSGVAPGDRVFRMAPRSMPSHTNLFAASLFVVPLWSHGRPREGDAAHELPLRVAVSCLGHLRSGGMRRRICKLASGVAVGEDIFKFDGYHFEGHE